MLANKNKNVVFLLPGVLTLIVGLLLSPARADDIEIYGRAAVGGKPNVLFIVDMSQSMDYGTDGLAVAPGNEDQKKINILRRVMDDVMQANAGSINAGILFFTHHTSGVRWPVSDLEADAVAIDSTLPAGTTVLQAINEHLKIARPNSMTNYASPLIEAARYFRGEPVWINDYWSWYWDHSYPAFDQGWGQYQDWLPLGANPAAYDNDPPAITWTVNKDVPVACNIVTESTGTVTWNNCGTHTLTAQGCTAYPAKAAWTETNVCTSSHRECTGTESQGECVDGSWINVCDTYGDVNHPAQNAYDDCRYEYLTDQDVFNWNGANYLSPITDSCQSNYIVFLSDGIPTTNPAIDAATSLAGLPSSNQCEDVGDSIFGQGKNNDWSARCVVEVVDYLATNDQVSAVPNSVVKTITIGFGLSGAEAAKGNAFLEYMAEKGQGSFYSASDETSLKNSLNSAIGEISGQTDEFTGIAIDSRNNSFSTDNRAFVNLFTPSTRRSWAGNTKGYFLSSDGLRDVDGNAALDADGKFSASARSFWSGSADGNAVSEGGASAALTNGGRQLLTYTGSVAPAGVTLTTGEHSLSAANTALTNAMLGVADDTARTALLDWLGTAPMADPLHSKPVLAKYANGTDLLFTMTNQGFLHAFDASTPTAQGDYSGGSERFAFMPQALLSNLPQIRANIAGPHIYGLDGSLSLRHDDLDADKEIDSNEKAVLYFGMRRGGRNYYAVNVTDPDHPKLLWRIEGGTGNFAALGQTWSRPVLTTLRYAGKPTKVLIFGGGYDPQLDTTSELSESTMGHAIYVVDADTGAMLGMVGGGTGFPGTSTMKYAIPSDLAVIDSNANGYADTVYFGDTGSQFWRITLGEGVSDNSPPTIDFTDDAHVELLGKFQSASGYSPRFFYAPAVALMSEPTGSYFSVVLGSGLRNNPLNTDTQDWVYMYRDRRSTVHKAALPNDFYDITENLIVEGSNPSMERAALDAAQGWRFKLGVAEKSLSTPLIFDDVLHFTTFEPVDVVEEMCSASSGSVARYYRFSVKDGVAVEDLSGDGSLNGADRVTVLDSLSIPTTPTLAFPLDGDGVDVYVDKDKVADINQRVRTMLWRQQN